MIKIKAQDRLGIFRQRLNSPAPTRSFRTQLYGFDSPLPKTTQAHSQFRTCAGILDVSSAGPPSGQDPASIRLPRPGPAKRK